MRFERSIDIDAPPEMVWDILTDIERWPEWTQSATRASREDSGRFGVGSRAKMWLRGGPAAVWTVTSLDEGRAFTWENRSREVHAVGSHLVETRNGGSRVTLTFEARGLMSKVLWPLFRVVGPRNVRWEAEGLKRHAEARITPVS
jgi:uncharacterized protein YndB with AHSA1/START domain